MQCSISKYFSSRLLAFCFVHLDPIPGNIFQRNQGSAWNLILYISCIPRYTMQIFCDGVTPPASVEHLLQLAYLHRYSLNTRVHTWIKTFIFGGTMTLRLWMLSKNQTSALFSRVSLLLARAQLCFKLQQILRLQFYFSHVRWLPDEYMFHAIIISVKWIKIFFSLFNERPRIGSTGTSAAKQKSDTCDSGYCSVCNCSRKS